MVLIYFTFFYAVHLSTAISTAYFCYFQIFRNQKEPMCNFYSQILILMYLQTYRKVVIRIRRAPICTLLRSTKCLHFPPCIILSSYQCIHLFTKSMSLSIDIYLSTWSIFFSEYFERKLKTLCLLTPKMLCVCISLDPDTLLYI